MTGVAVMFDLDDDYQGEPEPDVPAARVASPPRPDPGGASRFLKAWYDGRVVNLCAKHPDKGGMLGCSVEITDANVAAVERWVRERPDCNLYFGLNTVRPGLAKKAGKGDVAGIDAIGCDIDPPKGLPPAEGRAWVKAAVAKLKGMRHAPSV